MNGNSQVDWRIASPMGPASSAWKYGSSMWIGDYRTQPANRSTTAGSGLSQSNQLYAIIRPEKMIATQRASDAAPAIFAARGVAVASHSARRRYMPPL